MPPLPRPRARRWPAAFATPALAIPALAACTVGGDRALGALVPPPADRFARAAIAAVARGDTAAVRRALVPGGVIARDPSLGDSLFALRAAFASDAPDTVRLVGAEVFRQGPVRHTGALYQVHTPPSPGATAGRWATVRVVMAEELGVRMLEGFRAEPLADAPARIHAFGAPGKGVRHWLVLALALGAAAYSVWAAVRVARTPMPRRVWWALFALVGAGQLALNWTTGAVVVHPYFAQLLGGGLSRAGPDGPWGVAVSFPLGAVLALRRRRTVLAAGTTHAVKPRHGAPALADASPGVAGVDAPRLTRALTARRRP